MSGNSASLREQYASFFQKNRTYFEREVAGEGAAVSNRHILHGSICLSTFFDLTVLYGAEQGELFKGLLASRGAWIREAYQRYGQDDSLDERGVDRVEIALACEMGSAVAPDCFVPPDVPFGALETNVRHRDVDREERGALACLWGWYAYYLGDVGQCANGLRHLNRPSSHLSEEVIVLNSMAKLASDPSGDGWVSYRAVMLRWLQLAGPTGTAADDHQKALRCVLTLNWCKYRLGAVDGDSVFRTLLGETVDERK